MTQAPAERRSVRFGDIEARLDSGEILRNGRRTLLPEQPLRILARLLDRPGDVVSRDALRRELWPEHTFVDFEHGLNAAVKRLRDGLGDSANTPRYIETVPRRGYRFIGRIDGRVHGTADVGQASPASQRPTLATRRVWIIIAVLLAMGAAAASWAAWADRTSRLHPGSTSAVAAHRVLVSAVEEDFTRAALSAPGRLATERMIAALRKVDTVDVVPTAVTAASVSEAVAKAMAARAGLAVGILSHTRGPQQHFQARIQDSRTREVLYVSPLFTGGDASDQLAQTTAGAVAIHLDPAFGGLQLTSAPPTLDAYSAYLAGRELLEHDNRLAIEHLQRAAAISPGFLLPRLTLVMAHANQDDQARTRGQMAQIADTANRLTRAERLLVRYMTESLARRHASALRCLLELEALAPRSWIVNYGILQEALVLNRPRVTIDAFSRLPLQERDGRYNGWRLGILTRASHLVGDYARELADARRALDYEPGNLLYRADEVRPLAAVGDVEGIAQVIDETVSTPPTAGDPALVIEQAARELRAHGHRKAGASVAARGIEWLRARPASVSATEAHRAHLARLLYLAGRWDEAVVELQGLMGDRPSSIEYAGWLGAIVASRGDRARALEYDRLLHRLSSGDLHGRHLYWRACIAALLGESDRAVELLRDAFREGHFRGLQIHQSHEFERLREYPPFVALVTPRP